MEVLTDSEGWILIGNIRLIISVNFSWIPSRVSKPSPSKNEALSPTK
jgi:hypothetical protein